MSFFFCNKVWAAFWFWFWVTREEFFQNVFERARREEGEDVNLANLFSLSIRCLIVVCVCADAS